MATTLEEPEPTVRKLAGSNINLAGVGRVELLHLLSQNKETSVFVTSNSGLLVKTFDLDCGKPDEVSYGPYLSYQLEVENFEDIQAIEELRPRVPAYYGSSIDPERKFAFIAMEYLQGQNLLAWSQTAAASGYPTDWVEEFRAAIYESLAIVRLFHRHGIVLIDFKPDNVIRLYDGGVKFVDLGAFYTPRHSQQTDKYVYSATPDYAELVIDTSNVQTGHALTQGSDIFSSGVGLFELATGHSRLAIAADCAEQMLGLPSIYRFRDSQIKDVWYAYPHLKELLPLIATQLKERRLLFSEFWHLLKGYLAHEVVDWESLSEDRHREMLLESGTAFITDQLPDQLKWLAAPIARSTTLRSFRLRHVRELMELIADPVPGEVQEDIAHHNSVIQLAHDLYPPVEFRQPLNAWEVRLDPQVEHWAISCPLAASELREISRFTFLRESGRDDQGHRFFQIVGDSEADDRQDEKLNLAHLATDRSTWVGT
jgi:serine/threonine protein kinase